jgi:hypothetical protein
MKSLPPLRTILLVTAMALLWAAPVLADDAHHPPAATPPASGAPASPAARPATPGMGMGMMGQGGMMEHGMMGKGAAGQPGGMSMMSMMGMSEAGRLERVQGHLAFLEAELKVTNAQRPLWSAFAQAVKTNAEKHNGMMAMTLKPDTGLPDRLAHQEHALATRLEGVRAIRTALTPLYAALDAEQKKSFAQLLPMRMMM